MYIMFPIGVMYYFGTNMDNKFSVQGFWPSREQSHKIPTERQDIETDEAGKRAASRTGPGLRTCSCDIREGDEKGRMSWRATTRK
jgi:Pet100